MKTDDAIRQFNNSVRDLAQSLGITSAAVYQWGDTVPPLRAYQIRELLDAKASATDCYVPKVGATDTPPEQQAA